MALGVRWIAYLLPLSYFIEISRGVMLKATPISALGEPFLLLTLLAVVVLGLAVLRFRRDSATRARDGTYRARTSGDSRMTWGLTDATVRFGTRVAIDHLSFDVDRSAVTVIVGGDGAGS